jgi:hypothetical protein
VDGIVMKYGKAFLIKILRFMVNFSLFIGLVYNEPFYHVLILVLVLAPVSFLLGDLVILPALGSTAALLIDVPLIFGGLLAVHHWLGVSIGYGHFFLFTLITIAFSIEEFMYHIYVEKNIFGVDRPSLMDMINKL